MKRIIITSIAILAAFTGVFLASSVAAQNIPKGEFIRHIRNYNVGDWHIHQGDTLLFSSNTSGIIDTLSLYYRRSDTVVYAICQGIYHNINYEIKTGKIIKPTNAHPSLMYSATFNGDLYKAGQEMVQYSQMKTVGYVTALAGGIIAFGIGVSNSGSVGKHSNAGYLIGGGVSLIGAVITMVADGHVGRAGRILQIASGHINIPYTR